MPQAGGTDRLFVDEAQIVVRGGRGGDGCVSFRREKYVPKGGPDGGDGGNGGSVFLVARAGVDTLLDVNNRHHWYADAGRPGQGRNCHGRNGKHLEVIVPVGTLIYDANTDRLLKDLVRDGERICVGPGGQGGKGNARFVSATHQVPREHEPGRPGVERHLRLELKLIADIGLVGLPNAGKSTLLSRVTNARPKIGAYPFTTKKPQLGITELPGFRRMVLADIPGLIEGAHEGVGLGDTFLKHIERTRVIVHLLDLCPPEGSPTPVEAYHMIRAELEKYSPILAQRQELIVGNKVDLTEAEESLATLRAELGKEVIAFSGATGQHQRELMEALWDLVQNIREVEPQPSEEPIDFGDLPRARTEDIPGLDFSMDDDNEDDAV